MFFVAPGCCPELCVVALSKRKKFFFVLYCVRFALTLQRIAPYLIINIWYNYYTTIVNNYTLYTI